jgi:hypothetical protein
MLDDVLKFADIPRPGMGVPGVHHGLWDGLNGFPEFDDTRVHDMMDEPRQVFETLPQGRERERKDVETILEVLAEGAGLDGQVELPVGRGHNTHVDVHGPRPSDPLKCPVLQHLQPFDLQLQG